MPNESEKSIPKNQPDDLEELYGSFASDEPTASDVENRSETAQRDIVEEIKMAEKIKIVLPLLEELFAKGVIDPDIEVTGLVVYLKDLLKKLNH